MNAPATYAPTAPHIPASPLASARILDKLNRLSMRGQVHPLRSYIASLPVNAPAAAMLRAANPDALAVLVLADGRVFARMGERAVAWEQVDVTREAGTNRPVLVGRGVRVTFDGEVVEVANEATGTVETITPTPAATPATTLHTTVEDTVAALPGDGSLFAIA